MNTMHRSLIAVVALFVMGVGPLVSTPAFAEDEVLQDHWFAQFHGETKTGWSHVRRVKSTQDGRTVIVTVTEGRVVRGPGGKTMAKPIVSTSRFEEDEAGVVLSYATSVDIGLGPQTRSGTVKDGVISAKEDGKSRSFPYPKGALGPAAAIRAMAGSLKPGAKGKLNEFSAHDAATGQDVSWQFAAETKLINALGHVAWMLPLKKTDSSGLPETLLMLNGRGDLLGGDLNLGSIRYFRTEEVVAKADHNPDQWFRSRAVVPDRVIPASTRRLRTVLQLSHDEQPARTIALEALPESRTQKIVKRAKDGSIHVECSGGEPKGDLVIWMHPYLGDDIDKATLAKSRLVEIEHPRVPKMAKAMIGKLVDALSCARVLELRVKQYVRTTRPNVGFNSTAGVISARMGDSTESAVLTIGLARSLGLPARMVAGLVYRGPDEWPKGSRPNGAFVFHTWAEIYAGKDLWFAVDPSRMDGSAARKSVRELRGHGGFDATHIAVVRSDLATDQPFTDIVLPVLKFMDGLQIKVLEPKE